MARIIKANADHQGLALIEGSTRPECDAAKSELATGDLGNLTDETRTVMLDARRQAAKIVAAARVESDAACEAAAAKGYAEGFARGQNDGYEEGFGKGRAEAGRDMAKTSAELLDQLRAIVGELAEANADMLHAGRCELLDFALLLAGKIVGRVAARDVSAAAENVRKVLELTDRSRELRVKVNPSQLAALAEHLPELTESLNHTGQVRLVGDESVSPGGAKVHTAGGEIDATIETQLDNVVEAMLGSRVSQRTCGRYVSVSSPETAGGSSPAKHDTETSTEHSAAL